ncbi:hypothetical protein LCGC14_0967120 [marine sediment metagenome]|uniref:Uncharacterized protein n=1 Tax=marine sediment metagenome TaxID=412755 RepID=A0A0F9RJB2_9ZZZZ
MRKVLDTLIDIGVIMIYLLFNLLKLPYLLWLVCLNDILPKFRGKRSELNRSGSIKKGWVILTLLLLLSLTVSGCTADGNDPAMEPFDVSVTGNPEVKVVDDNGNIISIDAATRAIINIDNAHHEIHEGNAYLISINDHDLDVGDMLDLTVITPDTTKWLNVIWNAEGILAIHIFVYEDAITNVAGANLTAVNRNRNSTNVSPAILRSGDSFTDTGTILWQWHTGTRKTGGESGERDELILKQNTQYLFRIESEIINNAVSGILSWYELTNK